MSAESADAFHADIRQRIHYFRSEYQLTYSEAIGVLEMAKHEILTEIQEDEDEDED